MSTSSTSTSDRDQWHARILQALAELRGEPRPKPRPRETDAPKPQEG